MKNREHVAVLAISTMIAAVTNIAWTEFPDNIVYAQNFTGLIGFPPPTTMGNVTEDETAPQPVTVGNLTKNETAPQPVTVGNLTKNETAPQPVTNNSNISPLSNLIIDHAGGGFTSLQTDSDNKTWIATGSWELISNPSSAHQHSSAVRFNATIIMRGTDNSDEHEHKVSEFKLTNSSISSSTEGSALVFNGTATVETDLGSYSDVPVSIKIIDEDPAIVSIDTQTNQIEPHWIPGGGTISVLIDERIEDHFGNTPVYGNVKRE